MIGELCHGYGQVDPLSVISDLSPSVERLTSSFLDPRARIARLEGQLQQAKASGAALSTIRKLEGQLAAAYAALEREQEGVKGAKLTRIGVFGVLGATTLLLLAGTVFLVIRSMK